MSNKIAPPPHNHIQWITRTAVLTALLLALQWATAGTQAFAGQFITGSCVNAVLAVSVLLAGIWSGVTVAVLSPFFAFLLGIGPKLLPIVPAVAVGNVIFVLALHFLLGSGQKPIVQQVVALVVSAVAKFASLYLLVVKCIVPLLGDSLKPKQATVFSTMFSWPQLITALIGGTVALLMMPLLRKAIRSSD